MNFVDFCIENGYKPFRKIYNKSTKKWEYVEVKDNLNYFSSAVSGYIDIRLLKDGKKEIVYGIPCVYTPKGADVSKTHHPTLIYPNPFGSVSEIDRVFDNMSLDAILKEIEK